MFGDLKEFHDLWYKEYQLGLKEQSKNLFQVDYNNIIKIGDVFVVKNPMMYRPNWSLRRVMEVTPGDNDLVWIAKIRKPDGKVPEHSIKHLYLLKLSITHSHQAVIATDENSVSYVLAPSRPKRSPRGMHKKIKTLYGIDSHESVILFL